jgi:hypothetical protein
MDFVEIVIVVCAIAQPNHCEDKHLQLAWQGSLRQCVMAAQPYIAQWIGDHPQWAVKEYHCEFPRARNKADRCMTPSQRLGGTKTWREAA